MKIYSFFYIAFIFVATSCSAQTEVYFKYGNHNGFMKQLIQIDSNFVEIDSFLRVEKEIVYFNISGDTDDYDISVYNLLSNKEYDINVSCGLFMFLQASSHPEYFLYLKNLDGTIKILDYDGNNEVDNLTSELLLHFKRNRIENKEAKLKYFFGVIKFLNSKYTYPVPVECLPSGWECK